MLSSINATVSRFSLIVTGYSPRVGCGLDGNEKIEKHYALFLFGVPRLLKEYPS